MNRYKNTHALLILTSFGLIEEICRWAWSSNSSRCARTSVFIAFGERGGIFATRLAITTLISIKMNLLQTRYTIKVQFATPTVFPLPVKPWELVHIVIDVYAIQTISYRLVVTLLVSSFQAWAAPRTLVRTLPGKIAWLELWHYLFLPPAHLVACSRYTKFGNGDYE
jgi:hypothetical protein